MEPTTAVRFRATDQIRRFVNRKAADDLSPKGVKKTLPTLYRELLNTGIQKAQSGYPIPNVEPEKFGDKYIVLRYPESEHEALKAARLALYPDYNPDANETTYSLELVIIRLMTAAIQK